MPAFKRKIFYLSGFDPRGARFYYQLYAEQAAAFGAMHGREIEVGKRRRLPPHSVAWDVKDKGGTVPPWQREGGAPNTLTRNGWSKDSLKFSEQITIDGWRAQDGSKTCNMRAVKLADGRSVFAGSSGGDAPLTPKR